MNSEDKVDGARNVLGFIERLTRINPQMPHVLVAKVIQKKSFGVIAQEISFARTVEQFGIAKAVKCRRLKNFPLSCRITRVAVWQWWTKASAMTPELGLLASSMSRTAGRSDELGAP